MKKITVFSVRVFTLKRLLVLFLVMIPLASIWAESKNVTMQVGDTQTFYLPSSITGKKLKSVSFYSTSISYVQVVSYTNYSVKVKAVKAFSSPIIVRCDYYYYVTSGSYTYQAHGYYDYNITVVGETKVKPTSITLPSVVSLEVGETKDLVPTVIPANAEYTLTWSISDNSIATVYQNGMITGKSVGYADLKVKADNGVYTMCRISVYRPSPTSVSMKSSLSMTVGDTYTLSPSVYPSNAQYSLTWSSDNSAVATVSQSGVVTAKNSGKANISVSTNNGKTATCKVTVSAPAAYATITDAKYATFCDAYPRDFSNTDIMVYTVMYDEGDAVILKEVTDGIVPANNAVLLYKDVCSVERISIPESDSGRQPLKDNLLRISDGTSAKGSNVYVLANKSNGVGFYHWGSENSISAGKVYLLINDNVASREFINLDEDYTTDVEGISMGPREEIVYYDMRGNRVVKPAKGIYIMCQPNRLPDGRNGKKVVIK